MFLLDRQKEIDDTKEANLSAKEPQMVDHFILESKWWFFAILKHLYAAAQPGATSKYKIC